MKTYKTRVGKDKAFRRYSYKGSPSIGTGAGEAPDGAVVPILARWMLEYFPFRGIIVSKNRKSVDVQIYGIVKLTK